MMEVGHSLVSVRGGSLHVASLGAGPAVLLLHGWPEFWWTWEPVMRLLAGGYRVIAPDLRGFGDSDKPEGLWGAGEHAADMLGVLEALGVERAGVVGHDVGGAVIQAMARMAPERLAGLVLFDFVYPGIGARLGTPDRLGEIWYQSFHQKELAPLLVGHSVETCRAYFGWIIRHWAHRQEAFGDEVVEAFVANFMKPGNVEGGFNYYKAAHEGRVAVMEGRAPALPPIGVPTCVRWAEFDPLFPYAWTDRLGETFSDLDLAMFEGVGHFPHREDPVRAAAEISGFFGRIGFGVGAANA